MQEHCKNCENTQACVPFFIHENAMMHKDADNERMAKIVRGQRITNIIQTIVILLIVFFMVLFYTDRTRMWNNTISELNHTIVEVTHGKDLGSP